MKKIISLLILIICVFLITGCTETEKNYSYVEIEVNPKFELVVDEKNIVVAINGINDEAKMLLVDENLVNKKIDEALDVIINLNEECGFLLKGLKDEKEKAIKFCVSGELNEKLQELETKVSEEVNKLIEKYELNAKAEKVDAKTKEFFVEIVSKYDPSLNKEELSKLSYKELMDKVILATKEKSEFINVKLQEYYQTIKEYEFKIKYKENLSNALDKTYETLKASYTKLLSEFSEKIDELESQKVKIFTDAESLYVKAKKELEKVKAEVLKLEKQLSEKPDDLILKAKYEVTKASLELANIALDEAEKALEKTIDFIIESLNTIYAELEKLEDNFPETVDFDKAFDDATNFMNENKDKLFEKFEKAVSKENIERLKDEAKKYKEELKKQNK